MATLDPPFGKLSLGAHKLQVSLLGWHDVGQCTISLNDKYHFAASGNFNALGHKGTFDMRLALTDENATSTNGPCSVTNGEQTFTGTYKRDRTSLEFTDGQNHQIAASPDASGVIFQVTGYPKARIL